MKSPPQPIPVPHKSKHRNHVSGSFIIFAQLLHQHNPVTKQFYFKQRKKMIQINNGLATKALMSIENGEHVSRKRPSTGCESADTQRSAPLKRTRSRFTSGSFDMGDFLKASAKVEETITFPAIEWPSFDDDEVSSSDSDSATFSLTMPRDQREDIEDDDDEEAFSQCRRKRQCRGLTRSGRSCNLLGLIDASCKSERRGSNGSLS